jgi:hypothetical protein
MVWLGVVVVFDKRLAEDMMTREDIVDILAVVADIIVVPKTEGFCVDDNVVNVDAVFDPTNDIAGDCTIEGLCIADVVVPVSLLTERFSTTGIAVEAEEPIDIVLVTMPAIVIVGIITVGDDVANRALFGDPVFNNNEAIADDICV